MERPARNPRGTLSERDEQVALCELKKFKISILPPNEALLNIIRWPIAFRHCPCFLTCCSKHFLSFEIKPPFFVTVSDCSVQVFFFCPDPSSSQGPVCLDLPLQEGPRGLEPPVPHRTPRLNHSPAVIISHPRCPLSEERIFTRWEGFFYPMCLNQFKSLNMCAVT